MRATGEILKLNLKGQVEQAQKNGGKLLQVDGTVLSDTWLGHTWQHLSIGRSAEGKRRVCRMGQGSKRHIQEIKRVWLGWSLRK